MIADFWRAQEIAVRIVESAPVPLPYTVTREPHEVQGLRETIHAAIPGAIVHIDDVRAIIKSQQQHQELAMSVLRRFLAEHAASQLRPSPPTYWIPLPTGNPQLIALNPRTDAEEYELVVSRFHQRDFTKPIVLIERVQVR
jgi:hypothetical protein